MTSKTLNRTPERLRILGLVLLALVLGGTTLLALASGTMSLSLGQTVGALWSPETSDGVGAILWEVRLPRVALAILAGAGLAVAGAGTQAVLNNPLVSPSVLGVSAGAAFGASCAIIAGSRLQFVAGDILIALCAFAGALCATLIAWLVATVRRASRETVILAGIAVGFIFSGATIFLQYLAPWQDLRAMVFWGVGSLWNADGSRVAMVSLVLVPGAVVLLGISQKLNALALGDETAFSAGINVRRLRLVTLGLSALISAVVVSACGAIAFVGLIAPHMARLIFGHDNRWLVPASMLTGALLLLGADTLARTLFAPQELPVGVATALIGGPFFLFLLLRRRRDWWGGGS
ncbi:iron ABC transporter permease [Phaeovibrio sulfidiphilus]|uniref:Iron ABC transporter permease n=1 Tax=Phaeovibrio sulfidiphilus TaxID=1220600 RepID=A0A8J6YN16_9PROT|nr:iron ABC transporter permease [Phaeovibrio sulfidiphilus]MBE1236894.1 iron ABC transporter permease [Phaeovibrio sulfidiphilus]